MYTEYYGFSEKPFSVTPDPKFLFETPMHREALSSMIYGIIERRGFVVITGEVGTGKTTLIHTLFNKLEGNVKTAFIFHTSITFLELLKNILDELNIHNDDPSKTGMLRTLNAYLIKRLAQDEVIAVIIDEAQNLSREVMEDLRMLSNLETNKSKLLQIVLVGQPELERHLQSEDLRQLRQRIWMKCSIQPLTEKESSEYIEHRLRLVGSSSKLFTSEALSMICQRAGGIPRTINVLCENALLVGYAQSRRKIGGDIINEVIKDMEDSVIAKQVQPATHTPMISKPSYRAKGTYYTYAALGLLMITCLTLWALLLHQWSVPANNIIPQAISTVSIPAITNSMPEAAIAANKPVAVETALPQTPKPASASTPQADSITPNQQVKVAMKTMDAEPIPAIKNSMPEAAIAANKPAVVETALPQTPKPESVSTPQADSTTPNQQVKVAAQIMNTEPLDALRKEDSSDKIVTVAKNNCISLLAQRHYNRTNPTIISLILDANPSITDVNLILINQPVKIPEITKNSLIVEKPDGFCRIYLGTFETPDAAKRYQYEAILKEKEINVIPRKVSPRETWYRVEVNKIRSRDECLQVINTLQQKGLLPALGDSTTPQPGGNT